jgi:hypothetical protein
MRNWGFLGMARAEKLFDADVQIDPFVPKLTAWIRDSIAKGKAAKIIGITDDEPDFDTAKSDGQREKFHAMIGDINKTGVIVMPGRRVVLSDYDPEQCKALLVMWFANEKAAMGEALKRAPMHFTCPITGEQITIRPSTIQWGKKLTCEFVEYLYATGAMTNTVWSEKALEAYQSYREAQQ